ncbi:hypothetical protein SELR_24510 [Selenomonas ruminantium subsp. lactilytica TAM6421]|uniref:Uncharacterized protein n=1 Tax=Selenomonas ruminantium subsp. lactilytica (strain NBRC 103574 / TAM6421) TaxID=927704 RepID=I0GTS2_SELRL|nr:glycosyltransferase [Selenomonas ruminantium]BAL84159.1 hypothetical protein SELR_24510 [Selenomonas ruminantium subsp. lactilytica TAM6421]
MNTGDILNKYSEKCFLFAALKNPLCSSEEILQTISELKEVPFYQSSEAGQLLAEIQQLANQAVNSCVQMLIERGISPNTSQDELNRYFLHALRALQCGDYQGALRNLLIYDSYSEIIFPSYPHLYCYRGLAWYGLREYAKATSDFSSYLAVFPQDEIAHFYRGNALFFLGKLQEALDDYIVALQQHANFSEVIANAAILERSLAGDKKMLQQYDVGWQDSPWERTLALPKGMNFWSIPIFINNFNRLGCLQRLVEWLVNAGYKKIYILDNDSSYPPLLKYYCQLDENCPAVQVVRLKKNFGHTALWDSGILESMSVESSYVYTDSDVVPVDDCPKDFLRQLLAILQRYPLLKKVGLGLKTEGITCSNAAEILAQEQRYYLHKIEPDLYFGAVDTTFALYRNYRHYHLYVSARTTGDLMAWHLPWHYDYDNLPPDEIYYVNHANASASLVASLKKSGTFSEKEGNRT